MTVGRVTSIDGTVTAASRSASTARQPATARADRPTRGGGPTAASIHAASPHPRPAARREPHRHRDEPPTTAG